MTTKGCGDVAQQIVIRLKYRERNRGREALQKLRRAVLWYDSDASVEVIEVNDAAQRTRVAHCPTCWESTAECLCVSRGAIR